MSGKARGTERPDDIDRLPPRHQSYIRSLEQRLHEFETAKESQTPTRIVYDPYGVKRHLPDGASVRFKAGPDTVNDGRPLNDHARVIDVTLKDAYGWDKNGSRDVIEVHGDDTLVVLPNAANSVYITTRFLAGKVAARS